MSLTSDDLAPYVDAGYDLIPLHRWDYRDAKGRERGKSPRDPNWRTRPYELAAVVDWAQQGGNIGVRLRETDIVIDHDPRNAEPGVVERLCAEFGLNLDAWPHVKTGSGGDHWYGRLPEGARVLNGLDGFSGIEFKSVGRQVVAAGSLHPTGNVYELDDFAPQFEAAPMVPDKLLVAILRPAKATSDTAAPRIELDHLERCLDALDPTDYRDHDAWFELMQSVHYAVGGSEEGRAKFIAWSTGDPEYAEHGEMIVERWKSLDANVEGGVTTRTLFKHVADAGGNPNPDPANDFEPLGPETAEDGGYVPRFQRQNGGLPTKTVPNAIEAIKALDLEFARNTLSHRDVVRGKGAARFCAMFPGMVTDELTDDVCSAMADFAYRRWRLDVSADIMRQAATRLALKNGIDPLTTWLDSLEWDGEERLDGWLARYVGVEPSSYTAAVGRITLMGAVARAYVPGIQFQTMTVLEGAQGTLKSTLVAELGGHDWTLSGLPALRSASDKDVIGAMIGKWIVEIDELENLRKADIATMKAFLSRDSDRVRLPYERLARTFDRRCVFIGTTNEAEYLRDSTGNRRFLPIKIGAIDIEAFKRDRSQLWAEAAHIWRHDADERHLKLHRDLWAEASVEQEARRIEDPAEAVVERYLETVNANWVATQSILADCFNEVSYTSENARRILAARLPAIMSSLGWRKSRRRMNGQRGYDRLEPRADAREAWTPDSGAVSDIPAAPTPEDPNEDTLFH